MEWSLQGDLSCGRCYCHGSWCYLSLSSEVLSRTSSQMWGRWYLSIFLLRDGLLTLMYNTSLIALLRFWSSLPTMLKLSNVILWPVMFWWSYIGEGALRCSLNLSPKVLEDSPMYSSSHSTLSHWYLLVTPLFFWMAPWSFGAIRRFLIVFPPLSTPALHIHCMLSSCCHWSLDSRGSLCEAFECYCWWCCFFLCFY